ncbi:MAG: phosphate acyltransferase, partial [Succinivibrio dextrinosolvens]|nr:phosphate acyltransferase [Succinivibrio dextrinosolvens]
MSRNVMLVPAGKTTGIFTASLGLVKALNDNGVKAALFTPFYSCCGKECSTTSLNKCCAAKKLSEGNKSEVIEAIVANYNALNDANKYDVIVIEGVTDAPFNVNEINAEICHAFDANIISVVSGKCKCAKSAIDSTLLYFGNAGKNQHLGTILLNDNAPRDAKGNKKLVLSGCDKCGAACAAKKEDEVLTDFIATVKFDVAYYAPRAKDIAQFIDAKIVSGDENVRAYKVSLSNESAKERTVLVTDTLPSKTEAKTVILTDGVTGSVDGATVITTEKPLWSVAQALAEFPAQLRDDEEQKKLIEDGASKDFDSKAINLIKNLEEKATPLMSPAAFRSKLTALARAAHKKIALPEGDEPRTVCAAAKVAEQNIAVPVLFGKKDKILEVAKAQGVTLGDNVEFVDPDSVREKYVDRLVELRKAKGVTPEQALEML